MKINKLAGVKIKPLINKFSKQILFLKKNHVTVSEIVSDIHYIILNCSQKYDCSRGSFYNYLYRSLKNNLDNKINELLQSKKNSKLTDTYEYNTRDPLCVLITKYPEVLDYINYTSGKTDIDVNLIELCEENA